MLSERAWLIDASIYIFRAWFSLPDRWPQVLLARGVARS